jgi:nucleoside-diphosphate-sugar epimerase
MPDAVDALLRFADAPRGSLTRTAYNVRAFAPSADELRTETQRAFPGAEITFHVDSRRQDIIDSWPEDVDDSAARSDWGFSPRYDLERGMREYLIPRVKEKYS